MSKFALNIRKNVHEFLSWHIFRAKTSFVHYKKKKISRYDLVFPWMKKSIREIYNSDPKYGQFLRFCINGVLAVAIQYATYWILIKWIEVNIAYTLSYFVSFCCNFIITSYWTFHSKPSWKRLTGFGGSHIINYFVQLGFLNLYLWLGVTKEWAALLAMGSAVPINFALLHFVYKNKK